VMGEKGLLSMKYLRSVFSPPWQGMRRIGVSRPSFSPDAALILNSIFQIDKIMKQGWASVILPLECGREGVHRPPWRLSVSRPSFSSDANLVSNSVLQIDKIMKQHARQRRQVDVG
jgi:hypothetical protein